MAFRDRQDAGRQLAQRLRDYADRQPLVLALPRGGVPVALEVARALRAPLDVLVVRKLGAPGRPELGLGAIAPGGVRVLDPHIMQAVGATEADVDAAEAEERAELERRVRAYRGDRLPPQVLGMLVLLVDDGLATGGTMRAAVRWAKARGAGKVVVAVPVGPSETVEQLKGEADEVVVVETPEDFRAVGLWYKDFEQTTDEEVLTLLQKAHDEGLVKEAVAWH